MKKGDIVKTKFGIGKIITIYHKRNSKEISSVVVKIPNAPCTYQLEPNSITLENNFKE